MAMVRPWTAILIDMDYVYFEISTRLQHHEQSLPLHSDNYRPYLPPIKTIRLIKCKINFFYMNEIIHLIVKSNKKIQGNL